MKVLIAGANGGTGRLLVKLLAQEGKHEPVAMVRDEDQAAIMRELGAADVVVADLEGDGLRMAADGADAVVFAAGSGSKTGPEKTISVDQEGAKKLIDAAKESGIRHFVMLSSMGTDEPQGPLEHYLTAKKEADDYLTNSGLVYTIVRPGPLSDGEPAGMIEAGPMLEMMEERSIPRADVAKVLALSLDLGNLKNKTFELLDGDKPAKDVLELL